ELLWQVGLWLPPESEHGVDARARRQLELALNHPHEGLRFGGLAAAERLLAEYDVLGFAASGHPLSLLRGALPPGIVQSDTLPRLEHGAWVEVAGLVVARQRPETAKGFIFVLVEDEAGMVNVIVRPDVYERYRTAVRGEPLLWVRGKLAKDDGTVNVIAEEAMGLKLHGMRDAGSEMRPHTTHPARLQDEGVRDTIRRFEATESPVITDGEQAKPSFATYPIHGLSNLAPDGVTIPFADGHTRQLPRLTAGPFRYQTYADAYLASARAHAHVPVKQAVIAASALSLLYPEDGITGYPREAFLKDLVREAETDIRRCLAKGAHVVQLDFTEGRLAVKFDPSLGLLRMFVDLD